MEIVAYNTNLMNKKIRNKTMKTLLEELPLEGVDFNVVKKKGYDYFKMPGDSAFIQNKKILQLSLEKLYELSLNLKKRYENQGLVKVVILIRGDELFDSQVIAFFNKDICNRWFIRSSRYQTWKKTKRKNRLLDVLKLDGYKALKETHYTETIYDEELNPPQQKHDLWFYEE